jgi:hypothetical protein
MAAHSAAPAPANGTTRNASEVGHATIHFGLGSHFGGLPLPFIRPGTTIKVWDGIREGVVRYQIENWDLRADVYFVEIQSQDPSGAFLNKFADIRKPVKGKSAAKQKKDIAGFHVEDRRTKRRGVIFDQGAINHLDDSSAEVEGGYVCASLCMAGGICHLQRQEGHWKVSGFTIHIQS